VPPQELRILTHNLTLPVRPTGYEKDLYSIYKVVV